MTAEMKATLDEAERRRVVMQVANIEELTPSEVEQVVKAASDPAEAKMKAVDMICDKRAREVEYGANQVPNASVAQRTSVSRDEGETRMEGIITALGNRMFGGANYPIERGSPAAELRGMGPYGLCEMLAGRDARGRTRMEVAKLGMSTRGQVTMAGGMHTGSDFTYVTSELMNREMRREYEQMQPTWDQVSELRSASDFRTLYAPQVGGDFTLRAVNEHGEYEGTTLTDEGESYRVSRYGREVNVSFELVVNDDLGVLARLPRTFANTARLLEDRIVWELINGNSNLSDGTAFFASARGNLASSGGAISATTVGAGRTAMMLQRRPGAKADREDIIVAYPNLLIVPHTLETKALQFLETIYPEQPANATPAIHQRLQLLVVPFLSSTFASGSDGAWYLHDQRLPAVQASRLQGYDAPMVSTEETRSPKGITYTAEHMFGAGLVEPRGIYKNAGS